jgi:DNA polymerase-3 subunit beta
MQMKTNAGSLAGALGLVGRLVQRRRGIPILGAVKLEHRKMSVLGGVDMRADIALPTVGKARGAAVIDFQALAGLTRHIPRDEIVEIAGDHSLAAIKFNGSEYHLPSYAASDFPGVLEKIEGQRTALDNAGFIAAIRRVMFAASTSEYRYYLNGVASINLDGEPVVVATDGHRMAYLPIPFMPNGAEGAILPNDAVAFLARMKVEPKASVYSPEERRARFEYDGLVFTTECIKGTYPDIARVIPQSPIPYIRVNRLDVIAALRRLLSLDSLGDGAVVLSGSDDRLLMVRGVGDCCGRETIPCVTPQSGCLRVGFNGRYLIDVLSALRGDFVTFSASPPAGEIGLFASLITSDGDPLRIVLMPMRV